jgi:hypothetical protein
MKCAARDFLAEKRDQPLLRDPGGAEVAQRRLVRRQKRHALRVVGALFHDRPELGHQLFALGLLGHAFADRHLCLGLRLSGPRGARLVDDLDAGGQRQVGIARRADLEIDPDGARDDGHKPAGDDPAIQAAAPPSAAWPPATRGRPRGCGARPRCGRGGFGLRQDAALHVAVHFLQLVAIDLQIIRRRRRCRPTVGRRNANRIRNATSSEIAPAASQNPMMPLSPSCSPPLCKGRRRHGKPALGRGIPPRFLRGRRTHLEAGVAIERRGVGPGNLRAAMCRKRGERGQEVAHAPLFRIRHRARGRAPPPGVGARLAPRPTPKARYDAIIVGAGGHGLATAYYLGKNHGIRNVAVIEKGWLGGGNTGRNTTIIRSNYLQDPSAAIYEKARSLYETLSQDLNYNIMFSPAAS